MSYIISCVDCVVELKPDKESWLHLNDGLVIVIDYCRLLSIIIHYLNQIDNGLHQLSRLRRFKMNYKRRHRRGCRACATLSSFLNHEELHNITPNFHRLVVLGHVGNLYSAEIKGLYLRFSPILYTWS